MTIEIKVQTSKRTAYRMRRASEWIRTIGRAAAIAFLNAAIAVGAVGAIFFMCGFDSAELAPVLAGFGVCAGIGLAAAAVKWIIGG